MDDTDQTRCQYMIQVFRCRVHAHRRHSTTRAMPPSLTRASHLAPACRVFHAYLSGVCLTTLPKSIDDAFFERDVEMLELAFDGQMHFGCFYAHVKLKEQVRVSYDKSRGTPNGCSAQQSMGPSVCRRPYCCMLSDRALRTNGTAQVVLP